MNAEDAAELMRRLAALEAEVNRRPTERAIQAEIARQINMNNDNLTAIRIAIEGLGAAQAAQRAERAVGNHVKAKDIMPRGWTGDTGDTQGFSEYSFRLVGRMGQAHENGGEMMLAVDGMGGLRLRRHSAGSWHSARGTPSQKGLVCHPVEDYGGQGAHLRQEYDLG